MPTATITVSYQSIGSPITGTFTKTGATEIVVGPLSVAQGTPNAQSIVIDQSEMQSLVITSTKNATVTTTNGATPDVVTLTANVAYVWVGQSANPFAGGDVTVLTFACTEAGLTAVMNLRALCNQ